MASVTKRPPDSLTSDTSRTIGTFGVLAKDVLSVTITTPDGEKQVIAVRVWNETVSNLTLMALGSSAPEILLSVIEIYAENFEAGDLGPGTIVGSAAFNLFVIIAICVWSVPSSEVRNSSTGNCSGRSRRSGQAVALSFHSGVQLDEWVLGKMLAPPSLLSPCLLRRVSRNAFPDDANGGYGRHSLIPNGCLPNVFFVSGRSDATRRKRFKDFSLVLADEHCCTCVMAPQQPERQRRAYLLELRFRKSS
ncbi:sodium/calcium exchanger 1-like [Tropilaelaps mercedesae]|uniref:Sodium/calcium exchanger 1-like n=1 Tax=Tropilaelaps mercedesae TaxID=418985 RepID=A0A1V9X098_9ACAR|nr:sodium/calcium exchanger 1-like [Tropilaelaps mercedesae]